MKYINSQIFNHNQIDVNLFSQFKSSNKQQTQMEMDLLITTTTSLKHSKQISGKFCNIYRVIENTLTAFKTPIK